MWTTSTQKVTEGGYMALFGSTITTNMTNISTVFEANDYPQSVQGAMTHQQHRTQSFTAVLVLMSLFAFFTLSITGAIIVFCKKKNSVFALQKCEQESDIDYELDDFNTEIETSDDSADDYMCPMSKRSATYPNLEIVCNKNYRPHDNVDISEQKERLGGNEHIPRAHTFSFERYEYTPITLTVPSTDSQNNREGGARRLKVKNNRNSKAIYHQLQTSSRECLSPTQTPADENKNKSLGYSSNQNNSEALPECEVSLLDSFVIDHTRLLQHNQ